MNTINGYISFDMDETILQTGHLHGEYQVNILHQYGITDITQEQIPVLFGSQSSRVWMPQLLGERNIDYDITLLEKQIKGKNDYIKQKIRGKEVAFMPHAEEAIYSLFENNFGLGISTGSEREIVELFLEVYGLNKQFKAIASCYDKHPKKRGTCIQSKPSGEVCEVTFDQLEQQLGQLPKSPKFKKYMIGDTVDDVLCGHDAGAETILVPNSRLQKILAEKVKRLRQNNYNPIVLPSLKDIHIILSNLR